MPNALEQSKALFVRRWGEMGGYWGINRTMAEIHALLFVTEQPLCTDDFMKQLKISRGNASMNLRALVDWGLIRRTHKLGDRKEYFRADTDIWHMFETIMRERRRREVEPILETIDHCREIVSAPETASQEHVDPEAVRALRQRLDELQGFLTTMGALFDLALQYGSDGMGELARSLGVANEPRAADRGPTRTERPTRKSRRAKRSSTERK